MKFPPSFLDEIRARLPVSSVISRRVRLKKRGREYVGLSPFNAEKTPSFTVNDQKGFYHCFSSGKHGDIFRFLMEVEGLSFPEAVERLAGQAGLTMPTPDPEMARREARRSSLYDIHELAAGFFEARLQAADGAKARGYLADRGVAGAIQARFRIGYAPRGRYDLKEFLASHDVTQEQMIAAGLLIAGEDIAVSYDRFRDRIMFPITDLRGRMIAFGGRALSADVAAKYMNSPETDLFHKGHVLYNAAHAREASHKIGAVIAVEGYMDVIALAAAGFDHAVAPLGTALTEEQLAVLWRMSHEPILCFDGDKAGLKAAYRAVDTSLGLLKPDYSLKFALLPDGQDPDDLIRNFGAEAMSQALEKALPLADVVWLREVENRDWSTPERRAGLEERFRQVLGGIADQGVRRHYETAIRGRLRDFWRALDGRSYHAPRTGSPRGAGGGGQYRASGGSNTSGPATRALRSSALARGDATQTTRRELLLVYGVVNHPVLLEQYAEEFSQVEFMAADLDRLRREILEVAARNHPLDKDRLQAELDNKNALQDFERVKQGLGAHREWFCEAGAADIDAETGWLHTLALHRKSMTLQRELKIAERALAHDQTEENFESLRDLQRQLETVDGTEARLRGFGDASDRQTGSEF